MEKFVVRIGRADSVALESRIVTRAELRALLDSIDPNNHGLKPIRRQIAEVLAA